MTFSIYQSKWFCGLGKTRERQELTPSNLAILPQSKLAQTRQGFNRRLRKYGPVAHCHFTGFAPLIADSIKTLAPVSTKCALAQSGASNFQQTFSSLFTSYRTCLVYARQYYSSCNSNMREPLSESRSRPKDSSRMARLCCGGKNGSMP